MIFPLYYKVSLEFNKKNMYDSLIYNYIPYVQGQGQGKGQGHFT